MVGLWVAGGCALVKEGGGKVNTYLFGNMRGRARFPFTCEVLTEKEERMGTVNDRWVCVRVSVVAYITMLYEYH